MVLLQRCIRCLAAIAIAFTMLHATPAPVATNGQKVAAKQNTPTDLQKLKQKGVLRVGLTKVDEPPFYMVDEEGKLIGLDPEMARDIANALNIKVEFVRTADTWEQVVQQLENDEIDLAITMLSRTVERSSRIMFSEPYVVMHQAILLNRLKLANKYLSLQKLFEQPDNILILQKDSSYEAFSRTIFPKATSISFGDWDNEMLPALIAGQGLGIFLDEVIIKRSLMLNPALNLKLTPVVIEGYLDYISVGMTWDKSGLKHVVDTYIKNTGQLTTTSDLFKKYEDYFIKKRKNLEGQGHD